MSDSRNSQLLTVTHDSDSRPSRGAAIVQRRSAIDAQKQHVKVD
jgi:hypothetical protein